MNSQIGSLSVTDQVCQRVAEWIIRGDRKSGERLRIQEFAKTLGVSETPVREALIRLQHKGLVEVVPRAEYRVRVFERRDIEEIYELREALECFAVKNAAARMPAADLEHLQGLLEDAGKALDREEIAPSVQADIEFHARIVASDGNSKIVSLLTDLRDQIQIFRTLGARTPDIPRLFLGYHQRILKALMAHDAHVAVSLMSEHMRLAKEQAVRDYLDRATASADRNELK